ncbi:sortase-associated OmpA-like protein PdsO [Shewanella acanthi]|uniref:sortase-associated OmpA-like protein PdsO n=1 Tax=Shewanella acanthi TaxID=2864212 RepID=UPI001C65E04F|nr:sortase-associated OmpA-like protein PdsO [Shewanella acanthi]QYJ77503.1 sortase-associated OmpA-like protein PdsO [Shewanella acanthi]
MKKSLINLLVLNLVNGPVVQAAYQQNSDAGHYVYHSSTRVESQSHFKSMPLIGLGGGAVVGAMVGGPMGAIIGGFTGSVLGITLTESVAEASDDAVPLQGQLTSLAFNRQGSDISAGRYSLSQNQILSELALGMNVLFHQDSCELDAAFLPQLDKVAKVLREATSSNLEIKGYTDRHGDLNYNQALSEQRLLEVRGYLVKHGVAPERITTQAFGSRQSLNIDADLEAELFDSRVTLTMQPQRTLMANIADE